ncbi:hypothetical protein DFH09DRAFT_1043730 [Mycena vulgaris]|nr:hypothetical protein DFH09DRAFT_1043730 [Mycena vulgaris]
MSAANGMTYDLCLETCGRGVWVPAGGKSSQWSAFSQAFSTWLLPFLALVSQLPFGGDTPFENVMTIMLNVGSPTLAAYSVTLTALNSRWIHNRFARLAYPNAQSAARVLNNLQQSALEVTADDYLLGSLIALPENDQWWSDLLLFLDVKHAYTWSFSNIASIIWVAAAFLLTVISTFTDIEGVLDSDGFQVGFVWLWLLAIVTCCLNTGPRCDATILRDAMRRANRKLAVAGFMGPPVLLDTTVNEPPISIDARRGPARSDECRTAPIYNYARMAPWNLAVERIYAAFSAAAYRAANNIPVTAGIVWEKRSGSGGEVHISNRWGSLEQVAGYIQNTGDPIQPRGILGHGSRILHSSLMALSLTGGTIGSAILMAWYVPAKGLSCHSGSYLIYGVISILVWAMLMSASQLASQSFTSSAYKSGGRFPLSVKAGIVLRRGAKVLACLNATWIVLSSAIDMAGMYHTCWCNSSRLYLGSRAYVVVFLTESDVQTLWKPVLAFTVFAMYESTLWITAALMAL